MRYLIAFALLVVGLPIHGITSKEVTYTADGTTMKGYIAFDEHREGKRPGIIVVHEWWGHNDYTRKRADMLAELGYVALAVDMYGDGKTAAHPEDAQKFAGEVMNNMPAMVARFNAALETLRNDPNVDPGRIGAIGYCFGGGVVLHMARSGADLDGVVSFHGSIGTTEPARKGNVKAKILVCNGGADTFVSEEAIKNFKDEMESAGVDYTFKSYEGAIHAFTNPSATEVGRKFGLPLAYDEKADKESWDDMKEFFSEVFSVREKMKKE
jgi:dienelactone hydrolase